MYTRDHVGQKTFNIPTISKRVDFRVVIVAESHGYANGKRTEWKATVILRYDGKKIRDQSVYAAQPVGVFLENATDEDLWSALNLNKVTSELMDVARDMARGPISTVLEFGGDTLSAKTREELERYHDFERHTQGMYWVSVPGQVISSADDVRVDDMVVERNYYGNVIRYAYVEDINTNVDDNGETRYQFVHASGAPHPTSNWHHGDTLMEIIRVR